MQPTTARGRRGIIALAALALAIPPAAEGFLLGKALPAAASTTALNAASYAPRMASSIFAHFGDGVKAAKAVADVCILGVPIPDTCAGRTGGSLTTCRATNLPNDCSSKVTAASRNPAAYTVFAAATIIFTAIARAWRGMLDRFVVFWELFMIYLPLAPPPSSPSPLTSPPPPCPPSAVLS